MDREKEDKIMEQIAKEMENYVKRMRVEENKYVQELKEELYETEEFEYFNRKLNGLE